MGIQGYHLKFLGLAPPCLVPLSKKLSFPAAAAQHPHSDAVRARLLPSPSRTRLLQEPDATALRHTAFPQVIPEVSACGGRFQTLDSCLKTHT